jgi:hypothetical protein
MYKTLLTLLALLLIAGCQQAPATPTPGASEATPRPALPSPVPTLGATAAPTVAAPTAAAPSATAEAPGPPAPTAAPPTGDVLPAPLYVLDNGQIARIERDGATRALVTEETVEVDGLPPIATFAASPQGDLAYVVGDLRQDRMVVVGPRGENPRIIYSVEGHELSDLSWSPDGAQIYLRLLNNLQPPDIPSGVYRMPAAGGPPELLRADDPVDDPINPAPTVSGYRPVAPSPDGSRLLVEVYSLFYDGCGIGVMPAAGGEVLLLAPPEGTQTYCGEAAWGPDGAAVYFLAGGEAGPTIWRGDAGSGAAAAMAPADALARSPRPLADESVRFFQIYRDAQDPAKLTFALAELSPSQQLPNPLSRPSSDGLGVTLWAPDGSGAVAAVLPETKPVDLRWLSVDGEPVTLPSSTQGISDLAWGAVE